MLNKPPKEVLERVQKLMDKYKDDSEPKGPDAVSQDIQASLEKLGGPTWLKVAAARWEEKKALSNSSGEINDTTL